MKELFERLKPILEAEECTGIHSPPEDTSRFFFVGPLGEYFWLWHFKYLPKCFVLESETRGIVDHWATIDECLFDIVGHLYFTPDNEPTTPTHTSGLDY